MKVYGGNYFRNGMQVRGIICGTQTCAAQKTRSSLSYIREYWTETGNIVERAVTHNHPGVLFWCDNRNYNRKYDSYSRDDGQ